MLAQRGTSMHIVIGISLGTILTIGLFVWFITGAWVANRRRRKLERLRLEQEAARMKALERSMRPPLWRRMLGR